MIYIIILSVFIYLLLGIFFAGVLKEKPKDNVFYLVILFWGIIIPIILLFGLAMAIYDLGQDMSLYK